MHLINLIDFSHASSNLGLGIVSLLVTQRSSQSNLQIMAMLSVHTQIKTLRLQLGF